MAGAVTGFAVPLLLPGAVDGETLVIAPFFGDSNGDWRQWRIPGTETPDAARVDAYGSAPVPLQQTLQDVEAIVNAADVAGSPVPVPISLDGVEYRPRYRTEVRRALDTAPQRVVKARGVPSMNCVKLSVATLPGSSGLVTLTEIEAPGLALTPGMGIHRCSRHGEPILAVALLDVRWPVVRVGNLPHLGECDRPPSKLEVECEVEGPARAIRVRALGGARWRGGVR